MHRVLVVAPSWIGDTVMAQPLFRRLHERTPGLELHVLAPPWVAPLLERMPEVARVFESPFRHGELRLGARLGIARGLRQGGYERAIVLPNSLKSALVPFLADIPVRTGFVGEIRRGILNDARRLDKQRYPLMVERFALLAEPRNAVLERPLPRPRLRVPDPQRRRSLARFDLDPRAPVAVLCPGAEFGPAKRWPARYFGELAKRLGAQGYAVWALGSPNDVPVGDEVAAASGGICLNLCGRTTLDEAIDLMSWAALVVTNDSGLMHVAAALDRRTIAIYGSSSPGFTPPLSDHAQVVKLDMDCSPCFKRECPLGHFNCMLQLTPERVLARILDS
jgi:lipopolysaccharide heptosyltransferase II